MAEQIIEINEGTNSMGMWNYKPCTPEQMDNAIRLAAALRETTVEIIWEQLLGGKTIPFEQEPNYYYTHGYKTIRLCPAPRPAPKLVKCSCGHSVPAGLVMSASMGSSCSECYDRMSE